MSASRQLFAVCMPAFFVLASAAAPTSGFMARGFENASSKAVSLLTSLRVLEYGGHDRLDRIESDLSAAFQTIPKNEFGRIETRSARYLLQLYFAKDHGWQLAGLEPHGFMDEVSQVQDTVLIQEQAPLLAAAIAEAGASTQGLALRDVASLAATLERLVFDQSLDLLEASYKANGFSISEALSERDMNEVLRTYLLLFELSDKVGGDHPVRTDKFSDLVRFHGLDLDLDHIIVFERDAFLNDRFARAGLANPFREPAFTFEDATRVVDSLISRYGRWQNQECTYMSDHLKTHSNHGLFPLDVFFAPEMQDLGFHFTETVEYLEEIGALDPTTKQVRLANYITGPSNCILASRYYSICCISECDAITDEITNRLMGPEAPPAQIASVVANISSRFVEAPRKLPKPLLAKLEEIAERHDGLVQLHSRLFAQWLHNAFPNECPFPHIVGDKKVLQTDYWMDTFVQTAEAGEGRLQKAAAVAEQARKLPRLPGSDVVHRWSEEEVFYLVGARPTFFAQFASWVLPALRWLPAVALLLAAARHARAVIGTAAAGGAASAAKALRSSPGTVQVSSMDSLAV